VFGKRGAVFGKRGQLALLLVMSFVILAGAVELFVRLALDPAYRRDHALERPAATLAPEQRNGSPPPSDAKRSSWTGQSPMAGLSDAGWEDLQCAVATVICVVTGIGMEFLIGYEFLAGRRGPITQRHEHAWFVAQFLFPLMLLCAIQLAKVQNPLAMIFGIAGTWKFGFPETLLCYLAGYTANARRPLCRLISLMNGFGTLAHHSASMLFLCAFSMGLSPMTRPMVACSTPLLLQHLIVTLKYVSMPLYAIAALLIEIVWEWEILSTMELLYLPPVGALGAYSPLLVRCICAMLLAHWLYWASAILGAISDALRAERVDAAPDTDIVPHEVRSRSLSWQGSEVFEWHGKVQAYDGKDQADASTRSAGSESKDDSVSLASDPSLVHGTSALPDAHSSPLEARP
jgi:hypothetical protein